MDQRTDPLGLNWTLEMCRVADEKPASALPRHSPQFSVRPHKRQKWTHEELPFPMLLSKTMPAKTAGRIKRPNVPYPNGTESR